MTSKGVSRIQLLKVVYQFCLRLCTTVSKLIAHSAAGTGHLLSRFRCNHELFQPTIRVKGGVRISMYIKFYGNDLHRHARTHARTGARAGMMPDWKMRDKVGLGWKMQDCSVSEKIPYARSELIIFTAQRHASAVHAV